MDIEESELEAIETFDFTASVSHWIIYISPIDVVFNRKMNAKMK